MTAIMVVKLKSTRPNGISEPSQNSVGRGVRSDTAHGHRPEDTHGGLNDRRRSNRVARVGSSMTSDTCQDRGSHDRSYVLGYQLTIPVHAPSGRSPHAEGIDY